VNLTIPQIKILEKNLTKICKAEAGEKDTSSGNEEAVANRLAWGSTIRMLEEKTGRKQFSLVEIMNPAKTLKDFEKEEKKLKKKK
jgi:hypothetical protein